MKHPLPIAWFVANGVLMVAAIAAMMVLTNSSGDPGMAVSLAPNRIMLFLEMAALGLVYAVLMKNYASTPLVVLGFAHLAFHILSQLAMIGAQYYQFSAMDTGNFDTNTMVMMFSTGSGLNLIQLLLFIAAMIVALNSRQKTAEATF